MSRTRWTLTSVGLSVLIKGAALPFDDGEILAGGEAGGQTPPVLVNETVISYRINDLSEASISLGYSTKEGLKKLLELFPTAGEGAHQARVEIFLTDPGPRSYLGRGTRRLFSGVIIGFSHRKSMGQIEFVCNAKGGPYSLTQIPLASPGFHPSSGLSLGSSPLVSSKAKLGAQGGIATIGELASSIGDATSILDAYLEVANFLLKNWESSGGNSFPRSMRAAYKRFGLDLTKSIVEAELARFSGLGELNNIILDSGKDAVLQHVVSQALTGGATFWDLALQLFDAYGLELICMGDRYFVTAMNPLASPPSTNIVKASDETHVEIRDQPFDTPTRVIVTAHNPGPGQSKEGGVTSYVDAGEYPSGEDDVSPQERLTGIKTLLVQAPSYLAKSAGAASKAYREKTRLLSLLPSFAPSLAGIGVDASNREREKIEQDQSRTYNDYARFILMKQKFRQRTGACTMKFMPDLLPGFSVQIEDPLGAEGRSLSTVFGYALEVTHMLSSSSPLAQTSVSMAYIRYDGEVSDDLRQNPLYPGYNVEEAAQAILAEVVA